MTPRLLPILALCVVVGAPAQQLSVTGANTLRLERNSARGDPFASPFPFTGTTGYNELFLNFNWATGPDDHWNALISGVANDSPYRSPYRGLVPERLVLTRENGEAAVPYRVEAGDFFGFTSFRTQQRPLKGAVLELQPIPGSAGLRSSYQLFSGASAPSWRRFKWSDDNTTGVSWLGEHGDRRLLVNLLRNERRIAFLPDTPALRQQVASIAAESPFMLGSTRLRAEAELAHMRGDHDGGWFLGIGQDKRDTGSFLQLTGLYPDSTFNWRLRAERYGQDYRPFGAAIVPDRRSAEGYMEWTSASALNLRGRLQSYKDAAESDNPLDTRVAGVALSGPLAAIGGAVNLDVFRQDMARRDRSLDQKILTANGSLSRPFGDWLGTLNLLHQKIDDRSALDDDQTTRQLGLAATGAMRIGPLQGSVTPGLVWREVRGSLAATRDWHATLALALAGGPHRIALNAGRLAQNPPAGFIPDVATVNFGLDYRWRRGQHELGFDATVFDRKPRPGTKTEAYRVGLTWVYHFQQGSMGPGIPAGPALTGSERIAANASLLASVAPGAPLDTTLARLAQGGLGVGLRQPNAVVFEQRLLTDIEQRQRVVVAHDGASVEK